MIIKKFSQLTNQQLNNIIDLHFNHWVQHNPKMQRENTVYKFTQLYTKDTLPFGVAMFDEDNLIGFCVFKIENLKKYPEFYPWLSDLMIVKDYRGKGYGKQLVNYAQQVLKDLGYTTLYVWTDQAPDFYKKLGFTYKQQVEKNEGGYGQLFYKTID